jgi:hypothetical protein
MNIVISILLMIVNAVFSFLVMAVAAYFSIALVLLGLYWAFYETAAGWYAIISILLLVAVVKAVGSKSPQQ